MGQQHSTRDKPKAMYVLDKRCFSMIYGPDELTDIARLTRIDNQCYEPARLQTHPEALAEVEVIFSGWGGPRLDHTFLAHAPKLKALFYGAGSVSEIITEAAWQRGIAVTTAYAANAVPVVEYSLAAIIFSLKHVWRLAAETRAQRTFGSQEGIPGCYKTTVGLVSMGIVARLLAERLKTFDMHVLAFDPLLSAPQAAAMGITLCSLDELFRRSDLVSVHTPLLAETVGLITGKHIGSMKPGATLVNTARGQVINEPEMIDVLKRRSDLFAVLDVTHPEPPPADSPLFDMPNVLLTPHIAGSQGPECRRLGRLMITEFERWQQGKPLQWLVTRELASTSSHRPRAAAGV